MYEYAENQNENAMILPRMCMLLMCVVSALPQQRPILMLKEVLVLGQWRMGLRRITPMVLQHGSIILL